MTNFPEWSGELPLWREVLEDLFTPEQRGKLAVCTVRYEFDHRMTNSAGRYQRELIRNGVYVRPHIIKLSPFQDRKEGYETFAHEYAHLAAWVLFGEMRHRRPWKSVMSLFGLPPTRCHTIPLATRKILTTVARRLERL